MTELEEKLLAEVSKLEAAVNDLAGRLEQIDKRLDASTKLMRTVLDDLAQFSAKQQQYSEAQQVLCTMLQKLQRHFTGEPQEQ